MGGINYAVQAGNPETFEALVRLYGETASQVIDARGWSLLHIAATRPAEFVKDPLVIVRRLLELGCDPNHRTLPTGPEGSSREAYTAEDIAKQTGPLFHARYVRFLDEVGIAHDDPEDKFYECAWKLLRSHQELLKMTKRTTYLKLGIDPWLCYQHKDSEICNQSGEIEIWQLGLVILPVLEVMNSIYHMTGQPWGM